jgi:hypothetical protein
MMPNPKSFDEAIVCLLTGASLIGLDLAIREPR